MNQTWNLDNWFTNKFSQKNLSNFNFLKSGILVKMFLRKRFTWIFRNRICWHSLCAAQRDSVTRKFYSSFNKPNFKRFRTKYLSSKMNNYIYLIHDFLSRQGNLVIYFVTLLVVLETSLWFKISYLLYLVFMLKCCFLCINKFGMYLFYPKTV